MSEEKKMTGYPSIDKPWLKYYSQESIRAKVPECTIYDLIYERNKDHLDDIALNYYQSKITYGQMFENIEKAAKAFSAIGVKRGDIVIVCMVNTPEMVYIVYALNRLGAVANMVDPRTNIQGLHEYICESNSRVVVTIDLAYPAIVKAIPDTDVKNIIVCSPKDSLPQPVKFMYGLKNKSPKLAENAMFYGDFIKKDTGQAPVYVPYQKNTMCIMAHTGGTTGFPKGVMLSDDNVNAVAHCYRHIHIPFERGHRYFNDLPPFIMYGLCFALHTTLSYGLEVVLYPMFDSKGFPKQFAKYKPHLFCALPDHLSYLSTAKITSKMDLSHLLTAGVGGDSLDCDLEQRVNRYLKDHGCKYEAIKGYGMTELSAAAISTFPGANAIGSIGAPLIINTVKIVDTDTLQELKYNEIGEIWISGPSIMLGYYHKPEETAETIVTDEDGRRWIRTGDLGFVTQDGLVFHKGRIRRIYMTAHEGQPAKIFPMVVEGALKKSEFVSECSVVGRKRKGSDYYEAVAFVVKKDKTVDDSNIITELAEKCAEDAPTYMIPAEYRFVDQLPRTPIGKIDFRALEKEAEKF